MLTKELLFKLKIQKPNNIYYSECKKAWDKISKPIDGLGDFEDLICRISSIQGDYFPKTEKRATVVFCSDNGIVEEGVSQSSMYITFAVAKAM